MFLFANFVSNKFENNYAIEERKDNDENRRKKRQG
jgi:hypothetical protein